MIFDIFGSLCEYFIKNLAIHFQVYAKKKKVITFSENKKPKMSINSYKKNILKTKSCQKFFL